MATVYTTVTFQMSERTARAIGSCSVERMINTSISIAEASEHEYAEVSVEDWSFFKSIVTHMWMAVQDGIFRHNNPTPVCDRYWDLYVEGERRIS